jgi:hypothetical protein
MNVKFLKQCNVTRAVDVRCGDGCCSWTDLERDTVNPGDECEVSDWVGVTEDSLADLELNVDYEIVPD